MVHAISQPGASEGLPYFQRLWRILLNPETDLGNKIERLFAYETGEFDLDCAFWSRIDPDAETQYFERVHAGCGRIKQGNTVPLATTYCRKTISTQEGTMVISNALEEGWANDPAYAAFNLGSYVGTTVTCDGELYGTLCFVNREPREDPLTDEEVTLVKMYGHWLSYELNRWSGPSGHESTAGEIEERAISSSQIDVMADVLSNPVRRVVLLYLLEGAREVRTETLEREIDVDNVGALLHHTYLPKLEQVGYIKWDTDAGTISRGPNYYEAEPLLRLLAEYSTEFSG